MVSRVNPILEPKQELQEDEAMTPPRHQSRLSVKHALSSSESDEPGDEEEVGREYLVTRPLARTSLQEALNFLSQGKTKTKEVKQEIVVKTEPIDENNSIEAPTTLKLEKEKTETGETETKLEPSQVRHKRAKKAAEYDLKEALESL